jgi:hypothetical protein
MRGEANGGDRRLRGEEEEPPQQQGQAEEQAARPSSGRPQQPEAVAPRNVGYVGKHRLSAAIQRLDQELQSLQVPPTLLRSPPGHLSFSHRMHRLIALDSSHTS